MIKNSLGKRIGSLLLAGALMFLAAGCGNTAETNGGNNGAQNSGTVTKSDTPEAGDGSTAMGRYVEMVTDLSEYSMNNRGIFQLSDGSLVINDFYNGQLVSEDNGVTWNPKTTDWFTELQAAKSPYFMDLKIGADGTIGLIYDELEASEQEEETTVGEETASEDTSDEDTSDEDTESEDDFELDPVCIVMKPDGSRIEVKLTLTEDEVYPKRIWFTEDGKMFVTTLGHTIYEVKEDGSTEKYLTLPYRPQLVQFQGSYMIIDSYSSISNFQSIIIYDMSRQEYIEDEVLDEFIKENYPTRDLVNDSMYDLYVFPGEENVIYLAGKKGLHRHVIGGSAIEQIIDGNLSGLSNPANGIINMIPLENNEFLALFSGGKLVRFTYNPDISTIPSQKLSVFSLKENDTLRQAISTYQTRNPDVLVNYVVGMEENGSATREDVLKKLNTQIMAGEGPDLMVMDSMPMDSYIDKGMLLDLSPLLEGLTGEAELFTNLVNAFERNGKIYTVPCEVKLLGVLGKEEYVSQMTDLKKTADAMEALRKEKPEKGLIDFYSEEDIMHFFAMTSAPSWKTDSGEINQEAISEFLEQTKRIYDVQMQGASQERIERYQRLLEYYIQDYGITMAESDYFGMIDEMSYIAGASNLAAGTIDSVFSYSNVESVNKVKGLEDNVLLPFGGQSTQVFVPKTMVGINAASADKETAQEFLKVLLGAENQTSLFYGLPVNKAAFEQVFTPDKETEEAAKKGEPYSWLGMTSADGLEADLAVYWPDEAQIQKLRDWISQVKTPYIKDVTLEDAVCEAGAEYFKGNISLEQAVGAVMEKLAIYMAE